MPSTEEIGELVSKAREYVNIYQQTFISSKSSLDKATTPGFYSKGMELSKQAHATITAINRNGTSAYALVGFLRFLTT